MVWEIFWLGVVWNFVLMCWVGFWLGCWLRCCWCFLLLGFYGMLRYWFFLGWLCSWFVWVFFVVVRNWCLGCVGCFLVLGLLFILLLCLVVVLVFLLLVLGVLGWCGWFVVFSVVCCFVGCDVIVILFCFSVVCWNLLLGCWFEFFSFVFCDWRIGLCLGCWFLLVCVWYMMFLIVVLVVVLLVVVFCCCVSWIRSCCWFWFGWLFIFGLDWLVIIVFSCFVVGWDRIWCCCVVSFYCWFVFWCVVLGVGYLVVVGGYWDFVY